MGVWKNEENGKWYPNFVDHDNHSSDRSKRNKKEQICSICGLEYEPCYELQEKYMDDLFQRLITFNSIRMYWLFLDHEDNE